MNPINLQIEFLDGSTADITAVAADLIAFETKFDLSVARLEKEIRLTHLFFIAWHVLKRTGKTSEEFEKWAESVSIVKEASGKK
tara:strand:- start:324 stop:575 length:252 start_codon:yes stop_codon:yes gene_type:complete